MLLHNSSDVRERGVKGQSVLRHTPSPAAVYTHTVQSSTVHVVLHSNCSRSEYTSVVNYTVIIKVLTVSCIYYAGHYSGNLQITMSHSNHFIKTNKLN